MDATPLPGYHPLDVALFIPEHCRSLLEGCGGIPSKVMSVVAKYNYARWPPQFHLAGFSVRGDEVVSHM
jgi:hypothetical protein